MSLEQNRIPTQRPHFTDAEVAAVARVLESRWVGLGVETFKFEQRLQELLGVKHVIAVNSGTSAIHLALEGLKENGCVKLGDEVIVPSLTFVATIQPILSAGLVPVFCDVKPDNLNMDIDDVEKKITPNTRVIMPVHFGGEACDMDEIMEIAKRQNIWIVEDAAHAFGSTYKDKFIGNHGDLVCFSFDPIKNITCGEGGVVVTNHSELAERMTIMRILGISKDTWSRYHNTRLWDYDVSSPGFRYHMSNLNAAIGLEQLNHFEEFRQRKREIVDLYDQGLKGLGEVVTLKHNLDQTFPFFYVARITDGKRSELAKFLKEKGIETGIHYIPNHLQPYFSEFRSKLPVTEKMFGEILTLPLFYEMTDNQVEYVINNVKQFFA